MPPLRSILNVTLTRIPNYLRNSTPSTRYKFVTTRRAASLVPLGSCYPRYYYRARNFPTHTHNKQYNSIIIKGAIHVSEVNTGKLIIKFTVNPCVPQKVPTVNVRTTQRGADSSRNLENISVSSASLLVRSIFELEVQ
jgi:hypothetical protein